MTVKTRTSFLMVYLQMMSQKNLKKALNQSQKRRVNKLKLKLRKNKMQTLILRKLNRQQKTPT